MYELTSFDYFFSFAIGSAVVFLVFQFLLAYGSATEVLKEDAIKVGDSSLDELYISLSGESFFLIRIVAATIFFMVGTFIGSGFFGLVFAAIGYKLPSLYLKYLRKKRVKKVELQLVEGLELLGSSLKSGLTLTQATELLVREFPAPLSQEFALVLAENRLGVDYTEALEKMADRLDSTIVHILATGITITKRCGGDLTEIFGNIATTIREQVTIEGKLDAVTAQGRFQGLILGMMPFALIVILYFIDRQHVETLFGYTLGLWAVGLVCVMVVLAQLWIKKLLAIDV